MKKSILFLGLLALGIFASSSSFAQSSNGNSQSNAPSWAASQSGLSMQVVTKVLKEAKRHFGVSMGTLVSGYCSGSCKVQQVGITSTGDGLFKVEYGGGLVLVEITYGG